MAKNDGIGGTSGKVIGLAGSYQAAAEQNARDMNLIHELSYIEPGEETEAQNLVDSQFKDLCGMTLRENANFSRYFAVVKIYVRPEELKEITDVDGNKQKIYLPDTIRAEDRYQSCTGLVVALGPQAFQDKEGRPRGCRYKVGDFVLFPRTDIIRVDFNGIALGVMTDDRAIAVIKDPTHWMQGSLTFIG